jgi:hypothetical protein
MYQFPTSPLLEANMRGEERMLIRFAVWIHDKLTSSPPHIALPAMPIERWSRLARFHRRLAFASERNWTSSVASVRSEIRDAARGLRYELSDFAERFNAQGEALKVLSLREIHNELRALRSEFDDVEFDFKSKQIRVTTEPIELEGLYLGPFTIQLDLTRWNQDIPGRYRVIAGDPQPSRRNSEVTHPHVCGEQLCEGDGHTPIRQALSAGRLYDFFTVVANVLRTYNPSSPHVSIEKWDGASCQGCGESVSDDERMRCHRCEAESCADCSSWCSMCEYDHCQDCMSQCMGCKEWFCRDCITSCESCSTDMCSNCLNDLSQCQECHEREIEEAKAAEEELAASAVSDAFAAETEDTSV